MSRFKVGQHSSRKGEFHIEMPRSAYGRIKPASLDGVNIYCPDIILEEFRKIIAASSLSGTGFYNPLTEETEEFPKDAQSFTARHLQILARNEAKNTTGVMNISLYKNLLTEDQVARIRCLAKATIIVGKVHAIAKGGYPPPSERKEQAPEKVILIDQSGFQWQGDLRNTGSLFFYPDEKSKTNLPNGYSAFQNDMYHIMFGVERLPQPSQNAIDVIWDADASNGKVNGKIDLDGLKLGVKFEFQLALIGLNDFNSGAERSDSQNFKFLKAGFGHFCSGLVDMLDSDCLAKMELARLQGIYSTLESYFDTQELTNITSISLPYSRCFPKGAAPQTIAQMEEALTNIGPACQKLGIVFLGNGEAEDALETVQGYDNASTNCDDLHAMIGNEGVCEESVDAMLGVNIRDIHRLNATYNRSIQCRDLTIGINGYEFKKNSLLTSPKVDLPASSFIPDAGGSSPAPDNSYASFVPPTTSAASNPKQFTCSLKPKPKRLNSQRSVLPPSEKGLIPDSSQDQDDLPPDINKIISDSSLNQKEKSDHDDEKVVPQGHFPNQDNFTPFANQGRFFTTPDKMVKFGFSAAIFTGTVALVLLSCTPIVGLITAALLLKCAIVLITLAAGFFTVGAANFSDGLPSPAEKSIR